MFFLFVFPPIFYVFFCLPILCFLGGGGGGSFIGMSYKVESTGGSFALWKVTDSRLQYSLPGQHTLLR